MSKADPDTESAPDTQVADLSYEEAKEQLVAAFKAVLANPDYQEAMKKQGIVPGTLVGDDVAKMMQADHELYTELIAEAK